MSESNCYDQKKGRGKSCPKHVSVVCGLCGVCMCFSFFNSLQGDRDMSATIRALKSNRAALEAQPAAQVLCVWPSSGGPWQEGVFGTWGESEISFVL